MSLLTFHKDRHRTRRSTRPGHRWPDARVSGYHWHRNTDTSQNKPRNLTKTYQTPFLNLSPDLTDGAGALGAVLAYAPGRCAPGGDGAGQDGDHEDQGEDGDRGETRHHHTAAGASSQS